MLAKLLKRKESRQSVVESTTITENGQQQQQPLLQYRYQRPDLIGKVSRSSVRTWHWPFKIFFEKSLGSESRVKSFQISGKVGKSLGYRQQIGYFFPMDFYYGRNTSSSSELFMLKRYSDNRRFVTPVFSHGYRHFLSTFSLKRLLKSIKNLFISVEWRGTKR